MPCLDMFSHLQQDLFLLHVALDLKLADREFSMPEKEEKHLLGKLVNVGVYRFLVVCKCNLELLIAGAQELLDLLKELFDFLGLL